MPRKRAKTTMADIAKLSGVSQSTVSLVLNPKGKRTIPPETAARVLEAADSLHYARPQRSQARTKNRSRPVLVLVSDLTNPYYSFILHELELAAAPGGLHLICCNTYHHVQQETFFWILPWNWGSLQPYFSIRLTIRHMQHKSVIRFP